MIHQDGAASLTSLRHTASRRSKALQLTSAVGLVWFSATLSNYIFLTFQQKRSREEGDKVLICARGRSSSNRVFLLVLVFLLVAVPHTDALQAVAHWRHGFLHHQAVVDGLVALAVQRSIQDALQPEVPVGFLFRFVEGDVWETGGVGLEEERWENREDLRNAQRWRRRLLFAARRNKSGGAEAQGRVEPFMCDRGGRLKHVWGFYLQSKAIIVPRLLALKLNSHISVH